MAAEFHFDNITYVDGAMHVEIRLNRFSRQFQQAQYRLGEMVLQDCKLYMPIRTGSLQQRSHTEGGGVRVVFPGPYAAFQYGGLVMVDPVTGSPWARPGAKKVLTDRPLKYSSPTATAHWFDTAKARHGSFWVSETKRIGGGG